jgi:hypothetical protein
MKEAAGSVSARTSHPIQIASTFHSDTVSTKLGYSLRAAGLSVAARKGTILAAMAVSGPPPLNWSLSVLTGRAFLERPGAVKGAPLLGAAKRTLDGEDRSGIIKEEGKAPARAVQSGSQKVAPS